MNATDTAVDWLFDLGNSRLKYAPLLADGEFGQVQALTHGGNAHMLETALLPAGRIACVASVSTPLGAVLLQRLSQRFERIQIARTLPRWDRLQIAYRDPTQFGVDRFLALLAAWQCARNAALVVGVGTALTIDLMDAQGRHRGGRIAPSPTLMRDALHARAPQLPREGGRFNEFAIDSADALASGCMGAALALIERSRQRGADLLGMSAPLWLHGGGANALAADLPDARLAPALVLRGLAHWARIGC